MNLILNILLAVLFLSCGESDQQKNQEKQEEMEKKEINYLVFKFHDSSVPPPYHRSYTLDFRESRVKIIVDSYGDVLTDTTVIIGVESVDKALSFINKYKIKSKDKNKEEDGCTGGTGVSVKYGFNEEIVCDGYVYFCAGEQFGDLSGDLESLKYSLTGTIPNFSQYLKED